MRTKNSPNNTLKLYKILDPFWFDALKGSMGKFPKAYSQERRSDWPLLGAICMARSCTVQGLTKW